MTTSTLNQLLAEVQADQENPEDQEQQIAEFQAKCFAKAKVYETYEQRLSDLVAPLASLLPSVAEYEAYAAPHDGKSAGVQWDKERFYTCAAKQARIKNPALIMLTESQRCKATANEDIFPELSDEQYQEFLDSVDRMADWWEKQASVTSLDLVKSIIVHAVLQDENLCGLVFLEVMRMVDDAFYANQPLKVWREEL